MKVDILCIFAGVRPHAEPGMRAEFGRGLGGGGSKTAGQSGLVLKRFFNDISYSFDSFESFLICRLHHRL